MIYILCFKKKLNVIHLERKDEKGGAEKLLREALKQKKLVFFRNIS